MVTPRFGRLEKVNLKEIWNSEGDEFILWLAQEANLALLSQALAFDLRLETPPGSQGEPRGYLLCKDARRGRWVVVDNPSGQADHASLGRALFHAAGYQPVDIVCMAGQFSRAYLDILAWLNQATQEMVRFYGLQVEFWRIGDSPLAPKFNLVCSPGGVLQPGAPVQASEPAPPASEMAGPEIPEPQARPSFLGRDGSGELRRAARLEAETRETETPRFPTRKMEADEARATPDRTPSGMLREAAQEDARTPSGSLRSFQDSDTTVTPSGMLARLRVNKNVDNAAPTGPFPPADALDDTQQLYVDFWTNFWERVVTWEDELPPLKPMSQGWVTFPIGVENFYLIAFLSADHNLAGMGLVMDGPNASESFQRLYQEKDDIEAEIGAALDWRELPSRNESHIYLHRRNVVPSDRQRWPEYQKWFAEALETFTHVLGSRVRAMQADGYKHDRSFFSRS